MRALTFLVASLCSFSAVAAELPLCKGKGALTAASSAPAGDARARDAAQRGLGFLARETVAWQRANQCYGCHTQGVTLEALSVGVHHQYRIDRQALGAIVDGMLNLSGGARRNKGFSHLEQHFFGTAKAFGGNAFARYDQWVAPSLREDLLKVAAELLQYQNADGSITSDYPDTPPVHVGVVQRTYQAAQTWRQAHARSADDRWLEPIARAEKYLARTAQGWLGAPTRSLQELDYALLGMQAAGVSAAEPTMRALETRLLHLQNQDGGWGYGPGQPSTALATGQAVYTLRMLGRTERETPVRTGTAWLVERQHKDGGWSNVGSSKAEAMWAVLGLVAVDVVTVAVRGLDDGQRIEGVLPLDIEARDNAQGGGVTQVELYVDDLPVARACSGALRHVLDAGRLGTGKHLVDVRAVNARGQVSRRRLEVYAGDWYLTQVGARAGDGGTTLTLRNLAPAPKKGTVELTILPPEGKGAALAHESQPSKPGPMSFFWRAGEAPAGQYLARLEWKDASGRTLQTEEQVIVRDLQAEANLAQVQGHLGLDSPKAAAPVAANAEVQLVDDKGRIVQRVRSTAEGNYRFKNVTRGKYTVRFHKAGFAAPEQPLEVRGAGESEASAVLR